MSGRTPADLGAVAGIFAFYVTSSVATFEEDPPGVAQWRQRRDELAERGLPFLVAEAGGTVAGYAYASPWRPKPATGTRSRTRCTPTPGTGARGWGGGCWMRCWPGARTPACGRSSRSSRTPATRPR